MTPSPLTLIATVLPFGKVITGKEALFRFSITLDVSPNSQPVPAELLSFYQHYPALVEEILTQPFVLRQGSAQAVEVTAQVVDYRLSAERKALWGGLFPSEATTNSTASSTLTNPHAGVQQCSAFLETSPGLADLGYAALATVAFEPAADFQNNLGDKRKTKHQQRQLSAMAQFSQIKTDADAITRKLRLISEYGFYDNEQQIAEALKNARFPDTAHSLDTMFDTVAALTGNTIIQRLSGLTLDVQLAETTLPVTDRFSLRADLPRLLSALKRAMPGLTFDLECPATLFKAYSNGNERVITVDDPAVLPTNSALAKPKRDASYQVLNYDEVAHVLALSQAVDEKLEATPALRASFGPAAQVNDGADAVRLRVLAEAFSPPLTRGIRVTQNPDLEGLNRVLQRQDEPRGADKAEETYSTEELVRGNRFAIVTPSGKVLPLGNRRCTVWVSLPGKVPYQLDLPEELTTHDFAVGSESATKAILPVDPAKENGPKAPGYIIDNTLLTWTGENIGFPSIFSVAEDETNAEATASEGAVARSTKVAHERLRKVFTESFFPHFPKTGQKPLFSLEYEFTVNPQLRFGQSYELLITKEYKNNWGLPFQYSGSGEELDRYHSCLESFARLPAFCFQRNEPIGSVSLYLKDPLTDVTSRPWPGREGESVSHLVIRNFAKKRTSQRASRHLMPPAISFEHANWHGSIFDIHQQYGPDHSYEWYRRYSCRAEGLSQCTLPNKCSKVCAKIAMRDHYPQECELSYLPDPLAQGFRLEFFLDRERTITAPEFADAAEQCFLFEGQYPYLKGFEVELREYRRRRPRFERRNRTLILRLHPGEEVFLRARTILQSTYATELNTSTLVNDIIRQGYAEKLTPPLLFSAVHATQQPLLAPVISKVQVERFYDSSRVLLRAQIKLEQLNLYRNTGGVPRYVPNTLPVGELELLAKWEEIVDNPLESIALATDPAAQRTPRDPIIALNSRESRDVQEALIDVKGQLKKTESSLRRDGQRANEARNYTLQLAIPYDPSDTKHVVKYLSLREKSVFTSYYPALTEGRPTSFVKTSAERITVNYLNSAKPAQPRISSSMLMRVSDQSVQRDGSVRRRTAAKRIKISFHRPLLTTGAGARVGLLLYEPRSPYNAYFEQADLLSKTGRDILTNGPPPYDGTHGSGRVLLNHNHFVLNDLSGLRSVDRSAASEDLSAFQPRYVAELGCLTFAPLFDPLENQWYIEVELNLVDAQGKEVHTPFVQFSLVQYQEQSCVFPVEEAATADRVEKPGAAEKVQETTAKKTEKDCRLSEPVLSGFSYLQPTREIAVEVREKDVNIKVTFDANSVTKPDTIGQSTFYAVIQHQSRHGVSWDWDRTEKHESFSRLGVEEETATCSLKFLRQSGLRYRVLILETEEWGQASPGSLALLLESRSTRVVAVNTFQA